MIVFSFLCLLFVNAVVACDVMSDIRKDVNAWRYDGREFTIEVRKIGRVHSLTTQDEKKIVAWLDAKNLGKRRTKYIRNGIFGFIKAQIKCMPEVEDARDQRHENYRFRLFDVRKNDVIYKATTDHCQQVAAWLKAHGMQKHDDEKERIKIVNHGPYISLRAKNIEPYKGVIPKDEYRQALLERNKLIALLSTIGEHEDITSEALSQATLQFHFESKTEK